MQPLSGVSDFENSPPATRMRRAREDSNLARSLSACLAVPARRAKLLRAREQNGGSGLFPDYSESNAWRKCEGTFRTPTTPRGRLRQRKASVSTSSASSSVKTVKDLGDVHLEFHLGVL